ncbi:hypothetical protein RHGRI_034989 [Rhododendron griersonianum]|uniref:Uncharacterized protein n=1 Tax=Rhododendron griersonianum TaxID=479676 RepID=A0AAV6I396_9ERIC|nr:hypothetical protein RHGRI_034989 [Rhododendron griersonianum]
MVEHLQRYGVITSKKVSEVMETVDRALFVPEGIPPYVDSPMQIGHNATISAPHMHAMCLQLLEENLKPGMHALDVGSGRNDVNFNNKVWDKGEMVELTSQPKRSPRRPPANVFWPPTTLDRSRNPQIWYLASGCFEPGCPSKHLTQLPNPLKIPFWFSSQAQSRQWVASPRQNMSSAPVSIPSLPWWAELNRLADGREAREEGEFGLEDVGDEADTDNKLEDVVVNSDDSVDDGEL